MKWTTVWFPALAAGTASVILLSASRPMDRDAGWTVAEPPAWTDPNEARLGRELDARRRGIAERCIDKCQVALALLRGEMTLADAVYRFRQLSPSSVMDHLRRTYPGASDDELIWRQILMAVWGNSREDPERAAACMARIHAEIQRRYPGSCVIERMPPPIPAGAIPSAPPPSGPITVQAARIH